MNVYLGGTKIKRGGRVRNARPHSRLNGQYYCNIYGPREEKGMDKKNINECIEYLMGMVRGCLTHKERLDVIRRIVELYRLRIELSK